MRIVTFVISKSGQFMTRVLLSIFIFLALVVSSCTNDMKDVEALMSGAVDKEIATNVEIYYSDSAIVRVKISAPKLVRYLNKSAPNEEFPNGLLVEFYNIKENAYSWLKADYGMREVLKKQIITRKNVEMYNRKNEKILTSELIWDEGKEMLFTEKYVKIIQPENKDTTTGFGFVTNQDFTRFEIKKRGAASLNIDKLKEEFEKEKQ